MTNKTTSVVSVIALVLAVIGIGYTHFATARPSVKLGAVGGQLIEQYDPYVLYNGGINSALPIKTSSTLTSAGVTNSGVTDLTKATFCINFYATSTATQLHMVASTTASLPHGAAAVMTANYGSCS